MDRTKKAWTNAILFAVTLAVNTMGALGVINGLSQKEISDRYITLITPSSSTFSIWSVIYTLLLLSVILMIIRKDDAYYQKAVDEISGLFRVSCVLNIVWIVTFSYVLVELSTLFILGFVITLALLNLKLLKIQEGKRWLLPAAFGLYNGWLLVATVVNAAAALVKMGWTGFGLGVETWAVIMLAVAVALVILVMLKLRNAAFPLPVAWAYFGIHQYLKAPNGFQGQYGTAQTAALIGIAVLLCAAAYQFFRNRYSLLPAAGK